MPRKKAEKLSEKAIDKLYVIAHGFNISDPDSDICKNCNFEQSAHKGYVYETEGATVCDNFKPGELRFDPGTKEKPVFVEEKNFDPSTWKELRHAEAVVLFEKYESPEEKEKIVLEQIEE